jgi:uncharacterized protein YbaR (Trm112 family)
MNQKQKKPEIRKRNVGHQNDADWKLREAVKSVNNYRLEKNMDTVLACHKAGLEYDINPVMLMKDFENQETITKECCNGI